MSLLEVGTERRAEGAPRSTDLQDPKEAEDTARPLNALWKRLSEDGVSRKVRPFPGSWRGDTAYAGTHTLVLKSTHTRALVHTHTDGHTCRNVHTPPPPVPVLPVLGTSPLGLALPAPWPWTRTAEGQPGAQSTPPP